MDFYKTRLPDNFLLDITKIPGSKDDIKYNLLEQLADYQRLLSSTDWYVSRFAETGKAIPEDIKLKRAEAREIISNLKKQLEEGNK